MSRKDSVFNSAFPVHRNYNILNKLLKWMKSKNYILTK